MPPRLTVPDVGIKTEKGFAPGRKIQMRYDWLDEYLLSLPGVEKDYKMEWQWFRYKIRISSLPPCALQRRSTASTAATPW